MVLNSQRLRCLSVQFIPRQVYLYLTVFKMIWPIVATSEVPVYLPDGRRLRIFDWTSFNKNGADACPTILPML